MLQMEKECYFTFFHIFLLLSLLFFFHFLKVLKENIDIKKIKEQKKIVTGVSPKK